MGPCPSSFICSITEANKYTQEELRFMKSQDASYVALRAQTEMKVHFLVAWPEVTHTQSTVHLTLLLAKLDLCIGLL